MDLHRRDDSSNEESWHSNCSCIYACSMRIYKHISILLYILVRRGFRVLFVVPDIRTIQFVLLVIWFQVFHEWILYTYICHGLNSIIIQFSLSKIAKLGLKVYNLVWNNVGKQINIKRKKKLLKKVILPQTPTARSNRQLRFSWKTQFQIR